MNLKLLDDTFKFLKYPGLCENNSQRIWHIGTSVCLKIYLYISTTVSSDVSRIQFKEQNNDH